MDLFDLTGRLALVTGSSKGIGFALAQALASAGATLVLNARDPGKLEEARAALAATGAKVHTAAFDVTDPQAVTDGIAAIESNIGAIDILVNNAGMQHRAPLEDFPEDMFERVMMTNLNSVFIFMFLG